MFVAVGLGIGVSIALGVARWLQPLLFEVSARDPAVFLGVTLAVGAVSLVASLGPALRATHADASTVLRAG